MAYVEAISNGGSGTTAARSNAIRSGYFARNRVVVSMNGAQRAGIVKAALRISERIGREPSTADIELRGGAGYVPDRGHQVIIGHGTVDNRLFNGRIVRASRHITRHVETKPTYAIEATDLQMDIARATPPVGLFVQSLSASSIARGILSAATPSTTSLGFSAEYVASDLPVVAEFLVGPHESVVAAFDRLAEAIGATWYTDTRQRLHFYVSSDPEPKPTIGTLTGTSPGYLSLTRHTEFSRVFSRVVGVGVETTVTHDVSSDDTYLPVASAEQFTDVSSTFDLETYIGIATSRITVQGEPRSVTHVFDASNLELAPALLSAAPVSAVGTSYWVADVAYSAALDLDIFRNHRWVGLEGNYFRVSSVSGFSSSANTIYSRIFTPYSGAGAPPPTALGAVPAGTAFTAEIAEIKLAGAGGGTVRVIPRGAPVRAYYEVTSATIQNLIQSLTVSPVHGMATDVVDSAGLRPADLIRACDARLAEGHPDNWMTFELTTRDPLVQRGQCVYLSVTGPGETSGPSYTGAYTVQQVDISGFDEMADSKGPVRTATLGGSIQKPTLFNTLDTWDV